MEWLISLACGALGGNLGGILFKKLSLGVVLNSIIGILGGAGGMTLMSKINATTGNEYVNQIGGGAVGGTVLMVVIGVLKAIFGGPKK
jgi:uncharacterized membrane protein YeaQ/YmgE (transglycosylase-associated protein family)